MLTTARQNKSRNVNYIIRTTVFRKRLPPRVIYAATGAIGRSAHDGESCERVRPAPFTVEGVRLNLGHSGEAILSFLLFLFCLLLGNPPSSAVQDAKTHRRAAMASRGASEKQRIWRDYDSMSE